MGDALVALGGSFLAAGGLALLGRRVGLPTIPFFILAGILFGPHTPGLVLVEEPDSLELFATIGVVLLLFHLGLELSLRDLVSGGTRLLAAGGIYVLLNVGGGLLFGFALGWGTREAFVIGGAVGISSSAIVTKLLMELRRLANVETRLILGIIVVEDIFLAIYLAAMQPILDEAATLAAGLRSVAEAFLFLAVSFAVARFGGRLIGRLIDLGDDELRVVIAVGLAVFIAGTAEELGVSEAIGGFVVGLVLGESTVGGRLRQLVPSVRDVFAALFFFAFGLTIDPSDVAGVVGAVAAAVVVSLVLNLTAGFVGGRMHGFGRRATLNVGLTILPRGEFSLIVASLAAGTGVDERIDPFVALYVLVLALFVPVLVSVSGRLASYVPRSLFPRPPERG